MRVMSESHLMSWQSGRVGNVAAIAGARYISECGAGGSDPAKPGEA